MRKVLFGFLALCLLLPVAAGAERYDNWYDMRTGVVEEGDNDAVYTGGDRTIGATYFDVPKERGEVRISADPPVHIRGSVVINGGTFVFSGIDLTAAKGELRREPLEVVGLSKDNIPHITFYGNLSALGDAKPRWGIACQNAVIHVIGDVSGGRASGPNRALMLHNAQVTIEGTVRTLVDGKESEAMEASWFWLTELLPSDAGSGMEDMGTWLKVIDPESGEETVFYPEEASPLSSPSASF